MSPEEAVVALRAPFPAEAVGKLPRLTCKDCSNKRCNTHQRAKCTVCDNYISTAHIHLDYVGHAEVTDRLLSVDPEWSWEPMALDADGAPLVRKGADGSLTLWVRLTVAGITRLGVGSVPAGAFDAEKQLIGDALRNAAMRFGVALNLWSKSELESLVEGPGETAAPARAPRKAVAPKAPTAPAAPPPAETNEAKPNPYAADVHTRATRAGIPDADLAAIIEAITGDPSANSVTRDTRAAVMDAIAARAGVGAGG